MLARWWQRLWCPHTWDEGHIIDLAYGKGYLRRYTGLRCGKRIKRYNDPISFIE